MLLNHIKDLVLGIFVFLLILLACTAYAYYVNFKRSEDDPKKRKYHCAAIIFAPITLPILVPFYIFLFLLRVLIYGVFLILFSIALIFIHKPFILIALHKIATGIGEKLLEANTFLVRIFFGSSTDQTKNTKIPAKQGFL